MAAEERAAATVAAFEDRAQTFHEKAEVVADVIDDVIDAAAAAEQQQVQPTGDTTRWSVNGAVHGNGIEGSDYVSGSSAAAAAALAAAVELKALKVVSDEVVAYNLLLGADLANELEMDLIGAATSSGGSSDDEAAHVEGTAADDDRCDDGDCDQVPVELEVELEVEVPAGSIGGDLITLELEDGASFY